MKKFFIALLLLVSFGGLSRATAENPQSCPNEDLDAGGKESGGGAGYRPDSKSPATLWSAAGIQPRTDVENLETLPSLRLLIDIIRDLEPKMVHKSYLLAHLMPSQDRIYKRSSPEDAVNAINLSLTQDYVRMTGFDESRISLFGRTSFTTRVTSLLPSFYELDLHAQTAILAHESAWLFIKNAYYADVIAVEKAVHDYLLSTRDKKAQFSLLLVLMKQKRQDAYATWELERLVHEGFVLDAELGTLPYAVSQSEKGFSGSIETFMGEAFLVCRHSTIADTQLEETACSKVVKTYFAAISEENPESFGLKALILWADSISSMALNLHKFRVHSLHAHPSFEVRFEDRNLGWGPGPQGRHATGVRQAHVTVKPSQGFEILSHPLNSWTARRFVAGEWQDAYVSANFPMHELEFQVSRQNGIELVYEGVFTDVAWDATPVKSFESQGRRVRVDSKSRPFTLDGAARFKLRGPLQQDSADQ